jgi:hypothetical protein
MVLTIWSITSDLGGELGGYIRIPYIFIFIDCVLQRERERERHTDRPCGTRSRIEGCLSKVYVL